MGQQNLSIKLQLFPAICHCACTDRLLCRNTAIRLRRANSNILTAKWEMANRGSPLEKVNKVKRPGKTEIRQSPSLATARACLTVFWREMGRLNEVQRHEKTEIRQSPSLAASRACKSVFWRELGRLNEVEWHEKAEITQSPSLAASKACMAVFWRQLGKLNEVECHEKAEIRKAESPIASETCMATFWPALTIKNGDNNALVLIYGPPTDRGNTSVPQTLLDSEQNLSKK